MPKPTHRIGSIAWLLLLGCPLASGQGGKDWIEATSAAAWAPRAGHTSVVYNDKIWIIEGGVKYGYGYGGVWYSSDGVKWSVAATSGPWVERDAHASVVYQGKMWVIGGGNYSHSGVHNDVWCSENGTTWTCVTRHAQWSPRLDHAAVVHNGKIWVLGGNTGAPGDLGYLNDVWYSPDGANWTSATLAGPWPRNIGCPAAVSFQNKLWVINGVGVWCTADGANWTTTTSPAPWGGPYYPIYWREAMNAVACGGRIWVMGGVYPHVGSYSDVWSSSDGVRWTRVTAGAGWRPRTNHAVVVFNDRIWVLGGEYVDSKNYIHDLMNDVWYSFIPTPTRRWHLYR